MRLIECVPNFSEGRDGRIIKEIAQAIENVDAVRLMNVDSSYDANRTVMTFAGPPEAVFEAAFKAIECAQKTIDMTRHEGIHPRIGATDVCPLIPLYDVETSECIELSIKLAERVGGSLSIPVFLYAKSARNPQHQTLSYLRKGGYEALKERIQTNELRVDCGPQEFKARSGATVIGVRDILIAYNINLDSTDISVARSIARALRNIRDGLRKPVLMPLANFQAIAWYVNEYKCVQISTNLLDYKTTTMLSIFDSVQLLAQELNTQVTGSEAIGMVPLQALQGANQQEKVETMVDYLGLSSVKEFDWKKRILELRFKEYGWA
jgi:glutamate formiminotransferase/formiminotetrahydrofolate cyclodeaminase